MCRYSDVSRLKWRNVRFDLDLSSFQTTFKRKKKAQFRQGNKVTFATISNLVCPLKLLRKLQEVDSNSTPDSFISKDWWSHWPIP